MTKDPQPTTRSHDLWWIEFRYFDRCFLGYQNHVLLNSSSRLPLRSLLSGVVQYFLNTLLLSIFLFLYRFHSSNLVNYRLYRLREVEKHVNLLTHETQLPTMTNSNRSLELLPNPENPYQTWTHGLRFNKLSLLPLIKHVHTTISWSSV